MLNIYEPFDEELIPSEIPFDAKIKEATKSEAHSSERVSE
jgi:hypothetical protein